MISGSRIYPLAHIITGNATLQERTINYEFDLLVMDIVDYSKEEKDLIEGNMMKQDIYHRTLSAISEILASFRRGDQYDAYFRLANDPIAEPFDEDMEANACGWKNLRLKLLTLITSARWWREYQESINVQISGKQSDPIYPRRRRM